MEKNSYWLYGIITVIVVLMLILGRQTEKQDKMQDEIKVEEKLGSGFLVVGTTPNDADIFIDGVAKGKTPITISNVAAGVHNLVIKKIGYEDFVKEVNVEAGKRAVIETNLVAIHQKGTEKEETKEVTEDKQVEEKGLLEEKSNFTKVGKEFILYYDLSDGKITKNRIQDFDAISKRYTTYFSFIRYSPASIKVISKNIDKVKKEDCIGINGKFEYLHSGESLCVITKDGFVAAIGGNWENTENAELIWKVFE